MLSKENPTTNNRVLRFGKESSMICIISNFLHCAILENIIRQMDVWIDIEV